MNRILIIRRIGTFMALTILAGLLSMSCSDEDMVSPTPVQQSEDSVAVTFYFDGIGNDSQNASTRTTWDTNEFPSAALIGIFVFDENGNEVYSNAQYKYDATTRTFVPYSKAQTIYTGSKKNFSYYAYSPHKSAATKDLIHANWTYTQSLSNSIKNADVLRAVNTSTGKGTSTIGLNFKHMLCRLDVDYSYYANQGYTELAEQTLRLPAVGAVDMNLLTGELTYNQTSSMTNWKGFSQDNARHLVTTPYSFHAGDSLGYIRFKRPQGDTVKIAIKLVEDFELISGSKSVIKLSERTTVGTTSWAYSAINWGRSGVLDACASGSISIEPTITETRTVQDYVGTTPIGSPYSQTRAFKPTQIKMTLYSGAAAFNVTVTGGSALTTCKSENTSTTARTAIYSLAYKDPEGNTKNVPVRTTFTQPAGTRETIVGDAKLASISVSSASVTACGVVTPGSCTATFNTTTTVVSGCGTIISSSTATSTKTVTANAPSIAENTSTSSKSVNVTVYYTEGGIEKSTTVSATQAAATITGGTTTWSNDAQAECSKYEFPYTMSTATLSSTNPTYTTTAKVTGCGTVVSPAISGKASVTWSVGAWSTSSTDTRASISGTTITVPANTGLARTATVTATFSNGTSISFTITQKAGTHDVDVE